MNERESLMRRIQIADFAVRDAGLYLDTHPTDQQALQYFMRQTALLRAASEEYTQKFGPIIMTDQKSGNMFDWVKGPWPWEVGF